MERLRIREYERYGEDALEGGQRYKESQEFLQWAASYEDVGGTLEEHRKWLQSLNCPVLCIDGDVTIEETVAMSLSKINEHTLNINKE